MLTDWIHWLTSLSLETHFWLLSLLLLADVVRYALSYTLMAVYDAARAFTRRIRPNRRTLNRPYIPSVCVIMSGHNEESGVVATLASVWGSYPNLKIIVVDDGSTDQTAARTAQFTADRNADVRLLRKPARGGKASSYNFAMRYADADIVITIDCDSTLAPGAIYRIVQPFRDPRVGVVSGNVEVRRPMTNTLTWMQAHEYLLGISVGRRLSSLLGTMVVASGAFAAFRREAVNRVGGWDVGPGEDSDITLRLRKAGHRIMFAPRATCLTDVPTTWGRFFRQRCRWNRSQVRELSRKHLDLAYPTTHFFRWTNLLMMVDVWVFQVLRLYAILLYLGWVIIHPTPHTWSTLVYVYLMYILVSAYGGLLILGYCDNRRKHLRVCAACVLIPFYHFVRRLICAFSMTGEVLFRRSYHDAFYPRRVRAATWRW